MKRKKLSKQAPDLITQYLPDNPIMAQAWIDCLRWSVKELGILEAFRADTGSTFSPSWTPIDRTIDEVTGRKLEFVERCVASFHENRWGKEGPMKHHTIRVGQRLINWDGARGYVALNSQGK